MNGELKFTYKSIQNKDFLYLLREAEFNYNNKNNNYKDMIKELFECYNVINNFDEYGTEEEW